MATDVQSEPKPSVSSLVTGIVGDVQELIKQHLDLFRQEVREDFQKTKQAAGSLIVGGVVAGLGGLLLAFMLVYLLKWAWPALHEWHAFAIVGGAFAVVGAILIYVGKKRFDSFNPLPDQTLREIQWTIKPK